MAENLFNIKSHMGRAVWTPTWISNGHFAVKKFRVQLGVHLTSNDAVICAYPKALGVTAWDDEHMLEVLGKYDGLRVEFMRSPWQHRNAALFLDTQGHAAWFDAAYCDALRIETLYGPARMFAPKGEDAPPYYDAPTLADATIVIMPMRVPVDWDQVARTVAAAVSVDTEPDATPFVGMEPPPEEEKESGGEEAEKPFDALVLDAFADAIVNDPATREALRPTEGSVTITVGNREPVTLDAPETR